MRDPLFLLVSLTFNEAISFRLKRLHEYRKHYEWSLPIVCGWRQDPRALNPERCHNWRYHLRGQPWLNNDDVDALSLAAVYDLRQWNRKQVDLCKDLASNCRQWTAIIRHVRVIHEGGGSS